MPGALKARSKSESALSTPYSRVLHSCKVCVLAQNLRTDQTPIESKELANILRSHTGKRRTHRAMLACYEDRMEFKRKNCVSRKAFRDHLFYRDIIMSYRCVEYQTIFMLSVRGKDGRSTYYETYKCKNTGDADKIVKIILNATSNPSKIYSEIPVTGSHRSLRDSPKRTTSLPQMNKQTYNESLRADSLIRDTSSSTERSYSSPRIKKRYSFSSASTKSPVPFVSSRYVEPTQVECVQMVQAAAPTKPQIYRASDSTTTYFEYDPVKGADFNEKGPIFMFLERFPTLSSN